MILERWRELLDEEIGIRPDFIEHQLAHAVKDANGRAYNRTSHLAERHKMRSSQLPDLVFFFDYRKATLYTLSHD